MKISTFVVGLLFMLMVLATGIATAGESLKSSSGWFDFENCEFCQNLTKDSDLLDHSTWENFPIANGMINILSVESDYADDMAKAEAAMSALGAKMQSGEVNPMAVKTCDHCRSFGMLMMSGAVNVERVEGTAAVVTIFTSEDETVVEQLQEQARRDTAEMALLMEHEHHHD